MAFLFQSQRSSYWQAGWKDENGKRVNRTTKITARQGTRRQAQRVADAFEAASKDRRAARHMRETIAELHRDLTGAELPTATVAEYVEQFLGRKRGESSKATLRFYHTAMKDFLEWLGDRTDEDMNTIRPADLAAFRNHILKRVAETTAANKIKALRSLFSSAHKEGIVLEEPTISLKISRKGKKDGKKIGKRAFTLDELRLIKEHASGEWRSMLMFGLYSGQRLGDLATLRWENLDLVACELRLSTRKTDRTVRIPLADPLMGHIATLEAGERSEFLHPKLAEIYESKGASTLSNQFSSILAACGLRRPVSHRSKGIGRDAKREETAVSFHSLRATAVTLLHEAGIPAATVEEWVGHDSSEVHRAYIKIGRETLQKASDALPKI